MKLQYSSSEFDVQTMIITSDAFSALQNAAGSLQDLLKKDSGFLNRRVRCVYEETLVDPEAEADVAKQQVGGRALLSGAVVSQPWEMAADAARRRAPPRGGPARGGKDESPLSSPGGGGGLAGGGGGGIARPRTDHLKIHSNDEEVGFQVWEPILGVRYVNKLDKFNSMGSSLQRAAPKMRRLVLIKPGEILGSTGRGFEQEVLSRERDRELKSLDRELGLQKAHARRETGGGRPGLYMDESIDPSAYRDPGTPVHAAVKSFAKHVVWDGDRLACLVSDRFQTGFRPVSDQFQTSAIVGSAQWQSMSQCPCRMSDLRSHVGGTVMSDAQP